MPSRWRFASASKILAGTGVLAELPSLLAAGAWLYVTTPGFTSRGLTARLQSLALEAETDLLVHDAVTPNPQLDYLQELAEVFGQTQLKGIIALGGGSVIDTAKVLSVIIPSQIKRALDVTLREGQAVTWTEKLPLVAIPTTSGTGAEVTPFATIWDKINNKKYSVSGDLVVPDVALLDPELTLSLPYEETLNTGLDAVSHALESLWNINRTPISEAYSMQALKLAVSALPNVLREPDSMHEREKMQQASVLAGLAISQTRSAIAHSISYPLTNHFDVPHGLASSFTLPNIITEYLGHCGDEKEKQLLNEVREVLDQLDLFERIYRYATQGEIGGLTSEMLTADRAGNLNFELADITQIVRGIRKLGES